MKHFKKKHLEKREKAEKRKALKKERRESVKKQKEIQEAAIKSSFKKPNQINKYIINSLFTMKPEDHDPITKNYFYYLLAVISQNKKKKDCIKKYRTLLMDLIVKCPKLLEDRYWKPLWVLSSVEWLFPVGKWTPKGRGSQTLFNSLVNHLLVQYHVPGFLYSVFFIQEDSLAAQMVRVFKYLSGGGSMFKAIKTGILPIKLTKRMCHYYLQSPQDTGVFEGFRNAQVKAFGGERRLAQILSHTMLGRCFMDDEAFWFTVIMWFCKHSMLDPSQVEPLIDFITHLKREHNTFSITGRSLFAMIKEMKIWHGELARERRKKGIMYTPSGYQEGIWEIKGKLPNGRSKLFIWTMEEILNSKALAEEGKKMSHCVYSYHPRIQTGKVSIWSLKKEGERRLTVEVSKDHKVIYQARGKYNRFPKSKEIMVLRQWAVENMLKVKLLAW